MLFTCLFFELIFETMNEKKFKCFFLTQYEQMFGFLHFSFFWVNFFLGSKNH
jgi:hypothetical protein